MFYIQDCTRPQFHPSFSAAHVRNPLCVIKLPNLIPTRLPSTSNSARYPTLSPSSIPCIPLPPPSYVWLPPPRTSPATHCVPSFPFVPLRRRSFFSANARFATVHRARLSTLVRAFRAPETERKRNADRLKCL